MAGFCSWENLLFLAGERTKVAWDCVSCERVLSIQHMKWQNCVSSKADNQKTTPVDMNNQYFWVLVSHLSK